LTIGQQLAVGAGSALASGVIQKALAPGIPALAPKASAVLQQPTADSTEVAAAKKKSIIEQMASRGRASTILTDTTDKLGG
jgi:serine acetyltransferase